MKKYLSMAVILLVSAILLQGFQCTSPTMESAKLAYSKRDLNTALRYLNEEIAKNPNNGEAYRYRAEIYALMNNPFKAKEDVITAQSKKLTPESQAVVNKLVYNLWTNSYNAGLMKITNFYTTNEPSHLDTAIMHFDVGIELRPQVADFYFYKGSALEMKGDTNAAIESYKKYISELSDEVAFAKENSIFIDMKRDDFMNKYGKPVSDKMFDNLEQKTKINSMLYKINGKDVYIFSANTKDNPDLRLIGWRIGAPANWTDTEKFQYIKINLAPYKEMAQINYNRNNKQAAVQNLKDVIALNPLDQDASASIVQIYQDLNQMDIALKELDELIAKNPNNKYYWSQYGDIMMNTEKFDEAIEKYKKALDIDSDFDIVIRNIASAYKNKASIIQKAQADAISKDKKIQPEPEKYYPFLRESAKYFEKSLATETFRDDLVVLGELANIYTVIQDSKLNSVITKLEALEPVISNEQKENYYLTMISIYGANKMDAKYEQAQKKYEALKK